MSTFHSSVREVLSSRGTQQLSERSRMRGILETLKRGFLSLIVDAEERSAGKTRDRRAQIDITVYTRKRFVQ